MCAPFTRTACFYRDRPSRIASILTNAGGISVCGHTLTDTNVNDAHSAIEALCVSPYGNQRLQLVRELTAAALNMAAGSSATFSQFAYCNGVCTNLSASSSAIASCITQADNFNSSGECKTACWTGSDYVDSAACDSATYSSCTILSPSSCAVQ